MLLFCFSTQSRVENKSAKEIDEQNEEKKNNVVYGNGSGVVISCVRLA